MKNPVRLAWNVSKGVVVVGSGSRSRCQLRIIGAGPYPGVIGLDGFIQEFDELECRDGGILSLQ